MRCVTGLVMVAVAVGVVGVVAVVVNASGVAAAAVVEAVAVGC